MDEPLSLWNQIKEDFNVPFLNDPAIRTKFEVYCSYPGVWAIINHRIAHRLYKRGWYRLSRYIMSRVQKKASIDIHPAATIGRRVFIDHGMGVVIGETTIIDDDVLIYQGVTLGGVSLEKGKRHPTIRAGAVIGAGAKILGNIVIGANARVGANSVVVKSVPECSTAVGIPARIITKGLDKAQLSHNKLPDIDKELFIYLMKRVRILELALQKDGHNELIEVDSELDIAYEQFIKSMD